MTTLAFALGMLAAALVSLLAGCLRKTKELVEIAACIALGAVTTVVIRLFL